MHRTRSPTLLVFTLGPGREQARRQWFGSRAAAVERAVHAECLGEVLDAGRTAGCDLRLTAPATAPEGFDVEMVAQRGTTFGERLLDAVAAAERSARGPLVVVGTDTPGVGAELVATAIAAVEDEPSSVVVGPAADGGVYLLAASQSILEELSEVRWCSAGTLASLLAALRRSGRSVRLLPVLHDLDSRRDVERWSFAASGRPERWRRLIALIRHTLIGLTEALPAEAAALQPVVVAIPGGRAPPR